MTPRLDERERSQLRRKARRAVLEALEDLGGEASRAAIEERALASGGFTTRELLEPAPAEAAANYRRLIDHDLSWALTDLGRSRLIRTPRRGVWMLVVTEPEPASPPAGSVRPLRRNELRSLPYSRPALRPAPVKSVSSLASRNVPRATRAAANASRGSWLRRVLPG